MARPSLLPLLASLGLALVAMLLFAPSVVTAQPTPSTISRGSLDAAKKHMERGQELYMQGRLEEAASAFAEAYKAQPYAAFLYNEAVCHQKLGNNELALSLFHRYLAADPNAPDAEKVRTRIERIQEALALAPASSQAHAGETDADAGETDADAGETDADAGAGDAQSVATPAAPSAADAGTVVKEEGPDLMKSLVIVESEPSGAPVSIFVRQSPTASAFKLGKDNPGWSRVVSGTTPMSATLQVGRYHIVMERFADFHESQTDNEVAAGHVHQFKANLRQGEFMAFLRVTSPTRGARIYVDDPQPHKKPPWGTTPHEGLIGLGEHRLWVVRAGFKTATRRFSVSHGEEREELVELDRVDTGTLSFEGNAVAIAIEVDGKPVGIFAAGEPVVVDLTAGKHEVTASADGRKDLEAQVHVPAGQLLPVDLVMMPTTPRGAAWTQGIVSAALLGGGVVLGMRADSVYDNLETDQRAGLLTEGDNRYVKGKIYAISSTVCFGLSGISAGLSTYNFIKDPMPESGLRPGTPRDYPDHAGAPVVEFGDPVGIARFATTMATVPVEGDTLLLVMGEPNQGAPAAAYRITSDNEAVGPMDTSFCAERCLFGDSPASLRTWTTTEPQQGCFVLGVGEYEGEVGLLGRCVGGESFLLPVPGQNEEFPELPFPHDVITRELDNASAGQVVAEDVELGSSGYESPVLAAAVRSINAAWYYPHGSSEPRALTLVARPGKKPEQPRIRFGDTFGAAIAVASVRQGGHLIAISSPAGVGVDADGRVWLYRERDGDIVHEVDGVPEPWGCIPGMRPNFGAFMHSAQLLGDESEELIISDGRTLSIYDTGVLAEETLGGSCGGPLTTPGAFVAGVRCVETDAVSGCGGVSTDFGRSVAVADVDGDGRSELVVGVGSMTVHGTSGAGAVLVYSVDEAGQGTRLVEARYLSSADAGDGLGASVAAIRLGQRDVIAAGAPGLNSFFVFFCSTLGGAGATSFRCQ